MSDRIQMLWHGRVGETAHTNVWLNVFGGERWIDPFSIADTIEPENAAASPVEIVTARLSSLAPTANAEPCKRCGSKFRWRDCYSTTNLHCEKCNKPPSLAMVKAIFGLIYLGDGQRAWLEMTEVVLPIWREQQFSEQRNKRGKKIDSEEIPL